MLTRRSRQVCGRIHKCFVFLLSFVFRVLSVLCFVYCGYYTWRVLCFLFCGAVFYGLYRVFCALRLVFKVFCVWRAVSLLFFCFVLL